MSLLQYLRPKKIRPHVFAACSADAAAMAFKMDADSKALF
jgi:hypothetical protein